MKNDQSNRLGRLLTFAVSLAASTATIGASLTLVTGAATIG